MNLIYLNLLNQINTQVEEVEINNNFYQNNNYSNVNNNNLLELPAPSSPGLRRWQRYYFVQFFFGKYLFSNSDGREMLLAWTASSYRRQGSKWMDRCGIIMYLLLCNVLDCYIKPEKDLPMHVVRQMHRYMAVPRTPVQTDRLDTTEASAVYRATRDNNNECDRQVKSKQQKHPMW